jgi:AcrR family transcriptional regulator
LEERRLKIVQALHRCIREVGYSRTSLTAIAVKAGMSPSHIQYYFDNKDAILEFYLDDLCRRIVEDLRKLDMRDPDAWLDAFCDYYIRNPRISRVGLSVLVEIFGVSVHNPQMREIKVAFDREIRALLRDFFQAVGTAPGVSPEAAAEVAQALEAGFKYNAVFQDGYDADRTDSMFRAVVRQLRRGSAASPL